jgi:hypothetical protein
VSSYEFAGNWEDGVGPGGLGGGGGGVPVTAGKSGRGCEDVSVAVGKLGGVCGDVCVSIGRSNDGWGDVVSVPASGSGGAICEGAGCGVTPVSGSVDGWSGFWEKVGVFSTGGDSILGRIASAGRLAG